jgi:hypothetical protein
MNRLIPFYNKMPLEGIIPSEPQQVTTTNISYVFNLTQQATTAPPLQQKFGEVNTGMMYLGSKALPQIETIDLIKRTLTAEEKETFLEELLLRSIQAVRTGKSEYVDELRQTILSWEYTALVKSDDDYVKEIESLREEIKSDPSPGIEWREILRR